MSYGNSLYWYGTAPGMEARSSNGSTTTKRKYRLTIEFVGSEFLYCEFDLDNGLPDTQITKIVRDEWNKVPNNINKQATTFSATPYRVSFDGEAVTMKIIRVDPASPPFSKTIKFGCCEEIEIGLNAFNAY